MDEHVFPSVVGGSPAGDLDAGDELDGDGLGGVVVAGRVAGERADGRLEALTAEARAKAAAVGVAVAELVAVVAELAGLEGRLVDTTVRQWVAWQCGLTRSEAHRVCRLAERLPSLPGLEAALGSGALSPAVVDALVRVATPENEAALVATAEVATAEQLVTVARDFRRHHRPDATPTEAVADPTLEASRAEWRWDHQGRFQVRADLRADDGTVVEAALDAAFADLRADETTTTPVTAGTVRPEDRPRRNRAHALVDVARTGLAHRGDGDGLCPEAVQVHLHRHLTPTGDDPGPTSATYPTVAPGCGALHPHLADVLSCGAVTVTTTFAGASPLDTSPRRRTFTARQRRALAARDRTCRYPGCGRTRHLHAHHLHEHQHGGPTTLANGLLLCDVHHARIHHHHATLTLDTHGAVIVTRPDGTTLHGAAPPPPPDVRPPPTPPTDRRHTGLAEPLTSYARDILHTTWTDATPTPASPDTG